jgi:hypothetical protein
MFPLQPTFLDRADATKYLRETHGVRLGDTALMTKATRGGGPAYIIRNGRALYRREDLDRWALGETPRASTQQPSAAA